MIAIHQHFRLHHRHQTALLAQRGIAGQRMAVGLDAGTGRDVVADGNHRAPLGKPRAQLVVLLQAVTQAVQAFRHQFAGEAGQRHRALVHLDAGDHAVVQHVLGKRHPTLG